MFITLHPNMSDVPSIVYVNHCDDDDDDDDLLEDDFYFDDDERLHDRKGHFYQNLVGHIMNRPLSAAQQQELADYAWSMDIMDHITDRDIDDKFMKMIERSEKKMSTVPVQKGEHRFDLRDGAFIADKKSQHTCSTSTTSTADNDDADCGARWSVVRKETSCEERRIGKRRSSLRFWNRR
jgi:hypothetical protein